MEETIKILIIDDDEIDRIALGRMLKSSGDGFDIIEVTDGVIDAKILADQAPDCILMDYRLPKTDGLKLLKKLRGKGSKIPIIMLTGHGDEELAVKLMKAGANDYLVKGKFHPEYLLQTIRNNIRLYKAELQAEQAEEAFRQSRQRDKLLHEMNMRVLEEHPSQEILDFMCDQLINIFHLELTWVGIKENNGNVSIQAVSGISKEDFSFKFRWDNPTDECPVSLAIISGMPQILSSKDEQFEFWQKLSQTKGLASSIILPLKVKHEVLGVLCFASADEDIFNGEKLLHFQNYTDQVALALQSTFNRQRINLQTTALQSTANAILIMDSHRKVQWVNAAFKELLGYVDSEVINEDVSIFDTDNYNADFYNTIAPLLLSGRPWKGEITKRHKNRSSIIVESTITPLRNESGHISDFVEILQDVSDRKKAEAERNKEQERALLLNEVALKVLEENPVNQILQFVCDKLINIFNISLPLAWVGFKEPDGSISVQAVAGIAKNMLKNMSLHWDKGAETECPAGKAIRTAELEVADSEDPEYKLWGAYAKSWGILTSAAFPLTVQGQTIGSVCIAAPISEFFDNTVLAYFENFAGQIAISLQAALSRQKLRLHTAALQSAPNAIVITNKEGIIEWVNQTFCRLTGYKENEIIGQHMSIVQGGAYDPVFYEHLWRTILSGKSWKGEVITKRKDGSTYYDEMAIAPVFDEKGEVVNFVAVNEDITERKQAEEVLQRYQLLSNRTQEIIFMLKTDGKIIEANKAAEKAYGYTKKELLTMRVHDLRDKSQLAVLSKQLEKAQSKFLLFESLHRRKDGITFPVEISSEGAMIGQELIILSIVRDITERKQDEENMTEARKRAERAERLASLGTMAAGIAHEINQPLNSLKVTIDGMLYWHNKGKSFDVDKMFENLKKVSAQAGRIDEIIKHMHSFVRSEYTTELVPCNLNTVILSALNIIGNQLNSHGIMLHKLLAEDLPSISGIDTRLEEVIINLLINAMQSLDSIAQKNKEIFCNTFTTGNKVIMEIKDNGAGVREDIQDKIFEPFFTTKVVGDGMGLGLSIAHSIVNSYGGIISVQKNEPEGAIFRVEFPVYVK